MPKISHASGLSTILSRLEREVVGHADAKRLLAIAARRQRIARTGADAGRATRRPILLSGPRQIGKETLVRAAARAAGVAFLSYDACRLLPLPGMAVSVEQMLIELVTATAGQDEPCLTNAIIHIGNLDSLFASPEGTAAQLKLAQVMRGMAVSIVVHGQTRLIDTAGLLLVVSGDFESLLAQLPETPRGPFGLARPRASASQPADVPGLRDRLMRIGLTRELSDKVPDLLALAPLNEDELVTLLDNPERSPLAQAMREFHDFGVRVVFSDDAVRYLARSAVRQRGGSTLGDMATALLDRFRLRVEEFVARAPARMTITAATLNGGDVEWASDPTAVLANSLAGLAADSADPLPYIEETPRDVKALPRRPLRSASSVAGDAHWATRDDLRSWLTSPAEAPDCTALTGVVVAVEDTARPGELRLLEPQTLFLSDEHRRRNIFVVGKVGSGKTTRAILRLIAADMAAQDRSMVIIDPQGELTPYVYALARRHRGSDARVIYFNPKEPSRSVTWNPLHGRRTQAELIELVRMLGGTQPVGRADTKFFRLLAEDNVAVVFECVQRVYGDAANIGLARDVIRQGVTGLRKLADESKSDELQSFVRELNDNTNAGTTLMEMRNLVECWRDSDVRACTSTNEFTFEMLDERPTVVIFAIPEANVGGLSQLLTCFVSEFLNFTMRRPLRTAEGRRPATIALFIDEFASAAGRLPDLEHRINTLRKRGLAVVAAVQHLSQVHNLYGREAGDSVLAGFTTKFFIPPLEPTDADHVSAVSGIMTTETAIADPNGALAQTVHAAARVLSVSEAMGVPRHETRGPRITVCLPESWVFQMYVQPIYELDGCADLLTRYGDLRPPLRDTPMIDASRDKRPAPAQGLVDYSSWPPSRVRTRLAAALQCVDSTDSGPPARRWWTDIVERHGDIPHQLLPVVEELTARGVTVDSFYAAYRAAGTSDLRALLHFHAYRETALNGDGETAVGGRRHR